MPIATPQGTLDFKSVDKVTFVGASSNTVIDTTTGSLGVGVGVGGPTSNLHVVGNTRLEGDINMLHTANTASIKLNSNVVTEFPRSKKLIKYPRVALTSAAQTGSGYEGYFVSQDSATLNGTSNRQAWAFFDTQGPGQGTALASPHLVSSTDRFDGNGNYTGGDSLAGVSGDWIYIRLPDKIQLQSVDLWARYDNQRNPVDATVLGSLNGTNWSVIGSWQNAKFESGGSTSFTINSIQYYDYIGFVFEKIEANSSGGYINFHEIDLYGIPEYDPEADGVDVVVKSVPNVPSTDWLEVYYDAKDLVDGTVTSVTDLSGNGVTGTTSSGGVTVTDGAFVLDGSSDYIESGQTIVAAGTPLHTFSLWVKPSAADMDDTATHYLSVWGSGTVQNGWSGVALTGRGKLAQVYHGSGKHTNDVLFSAGRWYHVVVVIKSGTVATTAADRDVDFYVDGALYSGSFSVFGSQTGNSAYYLDWGAGTNTSVRLGSLHNGNEGTDSTIANFRLFNRALASDEIYQLYAYQKEYFGHGDLGMTLKAGRLGIGTSEPRSLLQVGDEPFGPGSRPIFRAVNNSTSNLGYDATEGAKIFTTEFDTAQINITNSYNTSTGMFTAPIPGYYFFEFQLLIGVPVAHWGTVQLSFYKNGVNVNQATSARGLSYYWVNNVDPGPNNYSHLNTPSCRAILYLKRGDYVQAGYPGVGSSSSSSSFEYSKNYAFFQGYLLST